MCDKSLGTIGILREEEVELVLIERLQENLNTIFPSLTTSLMTETLTIPKEAFDNERNQYRSDFVLTMIHEFTKREEAYSRALGIVSKDLFVPPLNYVFGHAECPGKAALISLHRLNPEFYGKKPDMDMFVNRCTKEAAHELGHTMGLDHCPNPYCVMYFSGSIFDTDRKQALFCSKCYFEIEKGQTD